MGQGFKPITPWPGGFGGGGCWNTALVRGRCWNIPLAVGGPGAFLPPSGLSAGSFLTTALAPSGAGGFRGGTSARLPPPALRTLGPLLGGAVGRLPPGGMALEGGLALAGDGRPPVAAAAGVSMVKGEGGLPAGAEKQRVNTGGRLGPASTPPPTAGKGAISPQAFTTPAQGNKPSPNPPQPDLVHHKPDSPH